MMPRVFPRASESSELIVLLQSGLELVASEAELHQIDAKVPEAVVICFSWELVHRRDGLSHDRVMLDAVDDPREQVDSPV